MQASFRIKYNVRIKGNNIVNRTFHSIHLESLEITSTVPLTTLLLRFVKLGGERISFLLDMMKDMAAYVESKDFELGLPVTNFARYHELWSMQDEGGEAESSYGDEEEEDEEEEEEE